MPDSSEWSRYWRSGRFPVEAMRAHFERHAYDLHSHDAYSFGITELGAQTFRCRGAQRTSSAGMVMAFNPDDPHDGQAAFDGGFTYEIVHIGPELIRDVLADAAQRPVGAPLFAEPVLHDPVLATALGRLCTALAERESSLAQDEALRQAVDAMVRRCAVRAAPPGWAPGARPDDPGLRRVRDLLHAHFADDLGIDQLAEVCGRSRFALTRGFRAVHGLSPSEYQRQLRLRYARRLLSEGSTPADAAFASGFADQSHLTRWFRRYYGITPGVFQSATDRFDRAA
ncbi:AraC family transcriptional regulator [Saccharopolyspora sp. K220]|uniref:AraC family transcriptional regulator n=1 Tax=Saccharopolyspora soli TaxID=2926618 RepID=UPI001F59B588|nr:AraC family transcriptional regulator [Saccharopolyspora soli]MCI2416497.1 AraC family transcriptional regulator [Saccharopolyspora soli]